MRNVLRWNTGRMYQGTGRGWWIPAQSLRAGLQELQELPIEQVGTDGHKQSWDEFLGYGQEWEKAQVRV